MPRLCNDELESAIQKAIERDQDLFMALEKSLKVAEQWMCGKCTGIHTMRQTCHYPSSLVSVTHGTWEVKSHIVGIL